MTALNQQAEALAGELGLSTAGSPIETLRDHTVKEVERLTEPFDDIKTLDHLLRVVASRLRVDLRFIRSDEEIRRLSIELGDKQNTVANMIREEFRRDGTEGLLLDPPRSVAHGHDYFAIIDARGRKVYRAYFTAWHELTHAIITPHLLEDESVRRTPPREHRTDPTEVLVDQSAARIAYYEPIFRPALRRAYRSVGAFSFEMIKQAIEEATEADEKVPPSSLYAAAKACVRLSDVPMLFLRVDEGVKKKEQEWIDSPQTEMEFPDQPRPKPVPKLRVAEIYPAGGGKTFEIASNMRVPPSSVIYRAYYGETVAEKSIEQEEQDDWETSSQGHLSPLPLAVSVTRRGSYTYALLTVGER